MKVYIHYLVSILVILFICSLKNKFICSYTSVLVLQYFIVNSVLQVNKSHVIPTELIVSNVSCVSLLNEFINKEIFCCQKYTTQEIYSHHTIIIGPNSLSGSIMCLFFRLSVYMFGYLQAFCYLCIYNNCQCEDPES